MTIEACWRAYAEACPSASATPEAGLRARQAFFAGATAALAIATDEDASKSRAEVLEAPSREVHRFLDSIVSPNN